MLNKNYMHWEKLYRLKLVQKNIHTRINTNIYFAIIIYIILIIKKLLYQYVLIKNFIQITDII